MASVVVILFAVLAVIGFVQPRLGAVFIFLTIWFYPNTLLYGTLPLNVRLDNLYCVFMAFVCLISPHSRKASGPLIRLALAWAACSVIGNVVGLLMTGAGQGWDSIVKDAARSLYIPMTAYVLYNLMSTGEQIDAFLRRLALAAAASGLLAIAMVYWPAQLDMFLIPRYFFEQHSTNLEMIEATEEVIHRRAQGTVGTIGLAMNMQQLSLMCLALMISHPKPARKLLFAGTFVVTAVTLAYTTTRSSIGGFLVAILWATAFTRKRKALIAILVCGAVVLLVQGGLIERIATRVTRAANPYETQLEAGVDVRLAIVRLFIEHFSPVYLFFGMGMTASLQIMQATAHNTYLGALVYGGLFGAIILILLIHQGVKLSRRALRTDDWLCRALGLYLGMIIVAMLVAGVAQEIFQLAYSAQLYFVALVLTERRLAQVAPVPAPLAVPALTNSPVIMPGPYVAR